MKFRTAADTLEAFEPVAETDKTTVCPVSGSCALTGIVKAEPGTASSVSATNRVGATFEFSTLNTKSVETGSLNPSVALRVMVNLATLATTFATSTLVAPVVSFTVITGSASAAAFVPCRTKPPDVQVIGSPSASVAIGLIASSTPARVS